MCKVSVIIPVYNVERYLTACLDSVLDQTMQDFEIIAIDDASPDGCGAILDAYAARDERIRVIHLKQNHMQGYGRNRGLEQAKGTYVYFLDSDDMILPETLDELTRTADEDTLDGVFFDSQVLFETEELKHKHSAYSPMRQGNYPDCVMKGTELFECFNAQDEWLVYVQRQFWRRAFLIGNALFSIEHVEHEDEFFSFAACLLAQRVRYVHRDYFIRRFRADSVMTRPAMPKDFHGYFLTFCKMSEFIAEHELDSPGIRNVMKHMYDCIMNYQMVFESTQDPKNWFTSEQLASYYLMRSFQTVQKEINNREEWLWAPLRSYKRLFMYGAGRVAQSAAYRLIAQKYPVSGFFVTKMQGNAESLYGLNVRQFSSYDDFRSGDIIIVAMAKETRGEVTHLLKERGIPYFTYARNELEGPFDVKSEDEG